MANETMVNPFAGNGNGGSETALQRVGSTEATSATLVEQQRAIAETVAALQIARQSPRDPVRAYENIMTACQRQGLAEQAIYTYARGGTDITGPSIRLAEMLAQNWGNIQFGIRELSNRNGVSEVEAFAWDVQTNTRQIKQFSVPHIRHTRQGQTRLTDPRDIYELTANQGARRLRACILGIIPGDLIDAAVEQCRKTLTVSVDMSPERMKKVLDKFGEFGVTKAMIEKKLQRKYETLTPAQMVGLQTVYTSIRDGIGVAGDYFQVEAPAEEEAKPATRTEAVRARMGAKSSASSSPRPVAQAEENDEIPGELDDAPNPFEDDQPAMSPEAPEPQEEDAPAPQHCQADGCSRMVPPADAEKCFAELGAIYCGSHKVAVKAERRSNGGGAQ